MVLESLLPYFPLPKFLHPPHIGISFSDSHVKAVLFKGVEPSSIKSLKLALPTGAISSGLIVKKDELVGILKKVREEFNTPFVSFTLPDDLVYIFNTEVPATRGGSITESVAFAIEENVPLSLAETVFDFVPTHVVGSHPEYKAKTVVAAAAQKEVQKFVDLLYESGFSPLSCIHESQSIANSIIPTHEIGLVYIIHARRNKIGIYLVEDGVVRFSTLRTILESDYKKQVSDEYEKFLEYRSKYDVTSAIVPKMLVCGEFVYAKEAVEALSQTAGTLKAELPNVWINVRRRDASVPNMPYEESLEFASAVGAALDI